MPILEELNSFKDAVSGGRPTFAREDVKRRGLSQRRKGAKHAKPENKNILAETRRRGDAETRRRERAEAEGRSELKIVPNRCAAGVTPDERSDRPLPIPLFSVRVEPVETLFIWKDRRSALRLRDSSAETDPPRGAGCLANQSQTSRRHRQ